jgi:hypothetical protein
LANVPTDDWMGRHIGDGGFFIERTSGEIWKFNSGQLSYEGLEYWLNWYAEGWRPGLYRLTLHDVADEHRFARLLVEQQVTYLLRELDHGAVWRLRVAYDEHTILKRLESCHGRLSWTPISSAPFSRDAEEGRAFRVHAHRRPQKIRLASREQYR